MAPKAGDPILLPELATMSTNGTTSHTGAYHQHAWSGGLNVASVDLIAMVVSDAGLASTEPQWWNASPIGCMLLGLQPRGGWQVMQRAVQWGTDHWSHCFGVSCKVPILYAYFACSVRNRLEVWSSDRFTSPMEEPLEHVPGNEKSLTNGCFCHDDKCTHREQIQEDVASTAGVSLQPAGGNEESNSPTASPNIKPILSAVESEKRRRSSGDQSVLKKKAEKHTDMPWNEVDMGKAGIFGVRRPTKLIDGSRGGQAFMCSLFCPEPGKAYGVEEQARLQLLSVILVAAGLAKDQSYNGILEMMREDFEMSTRLGVIFWRLAIGLMFANMFVLGLTGVVFYALWYRNIFGNSAPYVIQLCSLLSWAAAAVGLLMLGGNPRVQIDQSKPAPKHIQERLESLSDAFAFLEFGSLHGSVYTKDHGSCQIPVEVVKAICRWRLRLSRSWYWHVGMSWSTLFLLISITLQIAGSRVATTRSEIMAIVLLIATSVLRGAGISGPESWMVPKWKRRANARYAVKLQGQIRSRASVGET